MIVGVLLGTWLFLGIACGVIAAGIAADLHIHQVGRAIGLGIVGSAAGGFAGMLLAGAWSMLHPGTWLSSIVGACAVLAVANLLRSRHRT